MMIKQEKLSPAKCLIKRRRVKGAAKDVTLYRGKKSHVDKLHEIRGTRAD